MTPRDRRLAAGPLGAQRAAAQEPEDIDDEMLIQADSSRKAKIHAFMRLFPQPTRMRRSVEYVPVRQGAGRQARM